MLNNISALYIYLENNKYTLIFYDEDVRKQYIKDEDKFCVKEYEDYIRATTKSLREKNKEILNKRRMTFAISKNFKKYSNNPFILVQEIKE